MQNWKVITHKFITLCIALLIVSSATVRAEMAPDFTLQDSQGKWVSLQDYRGKPLILHFWATWCPYCKKLQPGLEKLAAEFSGDGVTILGVSALEEEGADPQGALRKRGMSFKTLVMGEAVFELYGVRGTPATVFINAKGEILARTNISKPEHPLLKTYVESIVK